MSHPDYVDIGSPEVKVIEECSELIQILCKVERFGWFSTHPDDCSKSNMELVIEEIDDVNDSLQKLVTYINEVIDEEELDIVED
jgi:hypothetical protein